MLPRPRFRIPLAVAVTIVLAIYALRSAIRGFDFRLDLPGDIIALVAFIVVLGVVAVVRRMERTEPIDGERTTAVDGLNPRNKPRDG